MGYTQAYSQAYDVPLDCKAGWLRREAWKMGQRPDIAMTAKQVRSEIVAETVGLEAFTRDEAFQQSQEDHALAHAEKQAGAAVSATKLSAQIAGHMDDTNPSDRALEALAELMASIARAGGDGTLKDGLEDGLTIDHEPN
jgi:hypothetical protein